MVRRVCDPIRCLGYDGVKAAGFGVVETWWWRAVMELAIVRRWVGCKSLEVIRWVNAWGRR